MQAIHKCFLIGAAFAFALPAQAVEYNNLPTEPLSSYLAIGVGFDFGGAGTDDALPVPYNEGFGFGSFHFSGTGDYFMPALFGLTGYAKYGTTIASFVNEDTAIPDDKFDAAWRAEVGGYFFISDEEAGGTASIPLASESWGDSRVTFTRTTSLPGTKAHYRTMVAVRGGLFLEQNTLSYAPTNPNIIVNSSFSGTYVGIGWIEALSAAVEITEGQYMGSYSRDEVEQYYADFILGSVSQDIIYPGMPELVSTGWRIGYKSADVSGNTASTFEIGAKPGLPDNYYLNLELQIAFSLD